MSSSNPASEAEAERRIEEARVHNAPALDLKGLTLARLPPSLFSLTQLQELYLSLNRLTALPERIAALSRLQELYVALNQLTSLPESIGLMHQLRVLDVSGNRLESLPRSIGQLHSLRTLDVSSNQLTALPDTIGELAGLRKLDASGNRLAMPPAAIEQLALAGIALPDTAVLTGRQDLSRASTAAVEDRTADVATQVVKTTQVGVAPASEKPSAGVPEGPPIQVALSYARKNQALKERLRDHLKPLERRGLISVWDDQMMRPGETWAVAIEEKFRGANMILLLVTPEFLASEYCDGIEVKIALERQREGATVIPLILMDCFWEKAPFGALQALPKDGKPVGRREKELTSIVREIETSALRIRAASYTGLA